MDYITCIILGLLQGITEPLPISYLAILFIYRKDINKLIKNFFGFIFSKKNKNNNKDGFLYIIKLIVSTIPVGIAGVLLNDYLEAHFNSLILLGFTFLFTALMLYIVRNIKGSKDSNDITFKDAIIIGLFQMVTIIPGISRSGTVLVACLICKLKREDALKYTFMLYFPVSLGTMLLKVPDLLVTPTSLLMPYLIGMLIAMVVTFISYKWLSNIVKNGKLWHFSIYCLCLALFIFIYFR